MINVKKIDSITAVLVFLIFFIITLFVYLVKIGENIEQYDSYHENLTDMRLIDKSFDSFLLKKSTFINYDNINLEMINFYKIIDFADASDAHRLFKNGYSHIISDIKKAFEEKQTFIEHFKSNNASLLNSIHYIFELNRLIQEDQYQTYETKDIATKQTLLLMKYYVNSYIDKKKINDNLKFLQQILDRDENNLELELLIRHTSKNVKRIENYNKVQVIPYTKGSLEHNLERLHIFLEQDYDKHMFIEKAITTIFFSAAVVILFILLIMHKRALAIKNELFGFKYAVQNSDNSIVMTDADKNITYVNDAFIEHTGYTREEVIGQNPRILKSGEIPQSVYNDLNKKLKNGKKWDGEFINVRKDKSLYYEKASIIPIYIDNEVKQYLAIKLNITDYIKQKDELQFLALHDSLTKLPNRVSIESTIDKKIKIAKRNNSKITILFIDLDRFKTINDTLGHDVGDELLIETAKRLKSSLRESDEVARIGGDEFLVVLETLDDEYHAGKVCEKIIELYSKPINTKEYQLNISLSIGVSIYPDDGQDYATLLKHADIAMYQAKDAGKNTFRYYQDQLSVDVQKRLILEQAFKGAIENNEFFIMYQPKYTLTDKKIVGLEALVRWENKYLNSVAPDEFIPIAEDTGFILELGQFIFRQACKDFLIFKEHSTTLKRVSINISAVQLYQETFVEDIISIIDEVGINPESIMLEITETYIMKNIQHSMKVLNEFKKAGLYISIDDFGTGHSSLSYLKKFPINELKIDKSFVDGILNDQNDTVITQSIIGLAQNLGYETIAEGIETQEQEEYLANNGCILGQGFKFCRPKIKNDLIEFLKIETNPA